MAQAITSGTHHATYEERAHVEKHEVTGWTGWIVFAGIMMMLGGIFQAIAGLVEIFQKTFIVTASSQMVLVHNVQTWGWTNLIIGAVIFLAGMAVLTGATWARVLGVILAMVYAVGNLVAISIYPLWSIVGLTIAVLVIYALIVHGGELREDY